MNDGTAIRLLRATPRHALLDARRDTTVCHADDFVSLAQVTPPPAARSGINWGERAELNLQSQPLMFGLILRPVLQVSKLQIEVPAITLMGINHTRFTLPSNWRIEIAV